MSQANDGPITLTFPLPPQPDGLQATAPPLPNPQTYTTLYPPLPNAVPSLNELKNLKNFIDNQVRTGQLQNGTATQQTGADPSLNPYNSQLGTANNQSRNVTNDGGNVVESQPMQIVNYEMYELRIK